MKYTFKELIDIPKLQELADELYMAASISSAIITMDGEIITESGWQRICTDFHRQHPQSVKDCIASDIKIRNKLDKGESFAVYKCPRGLVDASSPVIIAGEHVANVFSGQVFLETPDEIVEQSFREQALKFGFDETDYIKAFREVPVFTKKNFRSALSLLSKFTTMIGDMGHSRLRELDATNKLHKMHNELEIRAKEQIIEFAKTSETLSEEIVEIKTVEKALKKRESQLIETQAIAKIGNWDLDLIFQKLDWSNETYKLFDKNPNDFIPSFDEFGRLVHPNDFDTMQTKFNNALESDSKPYHAEIRIINDSGREWVMEAFGKVTRDDNGKALSIFGTAQDVTERSLIYALQESEEKYRSMMEAMSEASYICTNDFYISYMNPAMVKTIGYDATGKVCYNAINNLDKKCPWCVHDKVQQGEAVEVEIQSPRNNRYYQTSHTPIFQQDGAISKMTIYRDITDNKLNEIALKKSEQQFRDLFNSITDLVYTQDIKGRFTSVNPAMSTLLGYNMDEVLGHVSVDFMEPEHQPGFKTRYLDVIKKQGHLKGTACYFKKNSEKIYIEYKSSLVKQDDGEPYISGIGRDVTEKILSEEKVKKLQEQIAQSQKMKSIGTLAGGIAHDFNNILFPIVGYSEMLLEDIPEGSPFKNSINQIYKGALRASELVKQILTFSSQKDGKVKLMKMQPIIKEVLKLIRSTIPTTINIKQNLQSECGAIKADPTQIHQIVMNLSTNAYHAMEKSSGKLNVRLRQVELEGSDLFDPDIKPGIYACLSISDTGKGMDKELIEKIFNPFFTTKEIGKGSGMGLAVVHGIIKNLDGMIKVYSEPDKGTEFQVYLPLAEDMKELKKNIVATSILGGIEHILLVDDEEAILTMGKLMLERLGYKVTSRISSMEALEAFRNSPDKFNLVITDMAMPNMSGDKLAVELTKIRPDIPILLCTGFSETMSEEKAESLGISGFLLKPIVMKDLSQKIREVLDC